MDTPELFPWKCTQCQRINKKVATHCVVCHVHWTTGVRHQTEPKQPTYQATTYRDAWPATHNHEWGQWEKWEADDNSWSWQLPLDKTQSRSHSQSTHSSHSSRGRKGKGSGKSKKKGKTKAKEVVQMESKGTGGTSVSPFSPLAAAMPAWSTTDAAATSSTPFTTSTFNPNTAEQLAQKKECVAALKAAYPDGATIPMDTKELIEKMDKDIERIEKDNNKFVTKNLHSATKSLGKAQKTLTETLEAKRSHRTRWLKHITEAVTTWQGQLKEYQKQQSAFQDVVKKAKEDIEQARSAIQTLSSTASQAMLASMPPIAPVTAEQEEGATETDPEEEQLQGQLQTVLQSCAAVLNLDTAPSAKEGEVEDLTMEESEREKKRLRSMEPFGGSGKV